MGRASSRWWIVCTALAFALSAAPAAARASTPLGLTDCGPAHGTYQCSGTVPTWDGVPLDTTVTLPRETPGRLPLVVLIHGFGNSKSEYLDPEQSAYTGNAFEWAQRGYAVLTYTARGLWGSCGTPESRAANPAACARGYIHLADHRFEVRDTQELVGRLVDDGTADAGAIGVTGDSYGGGQSMALAALRDRVMMPDGSLAPWRSPGGAPLRIAAAAPVIPWTDLLGAIAPNGRTRTDEVTPPAATSDPVGVFKASIAHGILAAAQFATGPGQPVGEPFVPGRPMGYLAPAGSDPEADVAGWVERADEGEPYTDARAREVVALLDRYHSAYKIDSTVAPPPLFVASGFTDDLFPADEAIRFVNRTARDHPRTPLSLMLGDFGHQRASNKRGDRGRLEVAIRDWFQEHLRGGAPAPRGVVATTQTCPRDAPEGGPFTAPTFGRLARGHVSYVSDEPQTIDSGGGDPAIGAAIDPVGGGGDACATTASATQPGTATYLLPAVGSSPYTLLGSPSITARLKVEGVPENQQIAGRLWDVAPDGRQTLVARGVYRPRGSGDQAWQLYPNGWTFATGHVPKLELLGSDPPFARPSNGDFAITVGRIQLTLPTREGGAAGPRRRVRLALRCTRRGLRARASLAGARVRRVDFHVNGRRVARDARPPFARTVLRPRAKRRRVRVTARAAVVGERSARTTRTVRACRR